MAYSGRLLIINIGETVEERGGFLSKPRILSDFRILVTLR